MKPNNRIDYTRKVIVTPCIEQSNKPNSAMWATVACCRSHYIDLFRCSMSRTTVTYRVVVLCCFRSNLFCLRLASFSFAHFLSVQSKKNSRREFSKCSIHFFVSSFCALSHTFYRSMKTGVFRLVFIS